MPLKEIFRQERAIETLWRAFAAGKVPGAYIFAGPEGVGKLATARRWAKVLLCKKPAGGDNARACEACDSCRLFEADSHPDYAEVYKELIPFTRKGAGKAPPVELPIDVIREFIIEKVSARPTVSRVRLFIIRQGELLNANSQNALLKILEEPPQFCHLALLCTALDRLLPTTLSRCQVVRFVPMPEQHTAAILRQAGLEAEKADYFAHICGGSTGVARSWAHVEMAGAGLYKVARQLEDSVARLKYSQCVDLADDLSKNTSNIAAKWAEGEKGISRADLGRRAQKTLLNVIISLLRDAMLTATGRPPASVDPQRRELLEGLANTYGAEILAEKVEQACEAVGWIQSNANEKLTFEHMLLNLASSDRM